MARRKPHEIEQRVLAAQRERREKRHHVKKFPTEQLSAGRLLELVGDLHWYAIRVAPQKEFAAQEILSRKGIATYCPSDRRWRKVSRYVREKELRDYPLVPGYVFVGFVPDVPLWFDLFSIPIILGCVGINGEPRQIGSKPMTKMLRKFRNGLTRPDEEKFMETYKEFKTGQKVRVVKGPFEGVEVPVVDIVGRHARVLIELFGIQKEIEIPANILEPAA